MTRDRTIDVDYTLTPEEAESILAEWPEHTRVVDYLSGALDDEAARAFREQLRTDAAFREFATPFIEAWEVVPVIEDRLSAEEREEAWQVHRRLVGLVRTERGDGAGAPPGAERAPISLRSFRLLMVGVAVLLLVGFPVVGWIGVRVGPLLTRSVVTVSDAGLSTETVTFGLTSSAVLQRGSRLVWPDRATGGVRELMLMRGKAFFSLDSIPGAAWVLETPAGRLTTGAAHVLVESQDPQLTFVRVDKGEVRLEAVGASTPYSPVTLRPGDKGLLFYGQPPRIATQ